MKSPDSKEEALFRAVFDGDLDSLRSLVAAGADVNARERDGRTPLMCACLYVYDDWTGILLDAGADANAQDARGCTALFFAALNGNEGAVRRLIAAGADVDAETAEGVTALWRACLHGCAGCARLLLEAGANVNAAPRAGRFAGMSPLQAARENSRTPGHEECISLLQAAGAKE